MKDIFVFAMLPPFYEQPLYQKVSEYLDKIEKEFFIKVKKYSYIKSAFDHDVFIINGKIVFRFPRTEIVKKRLRGEIDLLNFLKDKVKINIPHYSYIAKDFQFAGYNMIPGKILSPSAFKSLSNKNKAKVIDELMKFINSFHRINLDEFKKFNPRAREDFIDAEKKVERDLEEKLFPKLSDEEVKVIKNFSEEAREYLRNIPNVCATHGDLYAYNTLWDKDTLRIGVIDFSDILIGDPAKDFEVFIDYGSASLERAYDNYKGLKDDNFLKRVYIYYKIHTIYTLLSSLLGARISYDYAYSRFRERFQ